MRNHFNALDVSEAILFSEFSSPFSLPTLPSFFISLQVKSKQNLWASVRTAPVSPCM